MKKHIISDHSNIPIVFLTARIQLKDQENSNPLKIKGYLKKWFVFKELKNIFEGQVPLASTSKQVNNTLTISTQ